MVAPQRQDNIPSDGEVATFPTSTEPTSAQGQLLGDPGPSCCLPTNTSQGWVGSLRGKWPFEIHCGEEGARCLSRMAQGHNEEIRFGNHTDLSLNAVFATLAW